MRANSLKELSVEDARLRGMAKQLCYVYKVPIHLADDFLSDAYLKANNFYFLRNKHLSLGGMYTIIDSIILDYLKLKHTKLTTITSPDEYIFSNIEDQPLDYEIQILNDIIYDNRIEAVTSLSEEDITTILLTIQTSLRIACIHTNKSIHYLRQDKKRILSLLRSLTN
jgi:hypothetical protein